MRPMLLSAAAILLAAGIAHDAARTPQGRADAPAVSRIADSQPGYDPRRDGRLAALIPAQIRHGAV